jgi:hypothetical protein
MKQKRTREKSVIKVTLDDEIIFLENAFIGGRLENNAFMGFYGGVLDLGEMGISLMSLLRGVVKALNEECNLTLNQAEKYIIFCLNEALQKEKEESQADHIQKELYQIVNRFMDNQNRP